MKINQFTVLVGQHVLLVPYEAYHVLKYHEWMKDEELQTLTASEGLSLEEEYAMQLSWREDEDKCTFIVLDRKTFEESKVETDSEREIEAMIGDVNLFFIEEEEEAPASKDNILSDGDILPGRCGEEAFISSSSTNTASNSISSPRKTAEVELMIAEKSFRGQGRGKEAVALLLHYGMNHLNLGRFVAKIGSTNSVSLSLFEKMGFRRTKFNRVFDEVTLKVEVPAIASAELNGKQQVEQKRFPLDFRIRIEELVGSVVMTSRECPFSKSK